MTKKEFFLCSLLFLLLSGVFFYKVFLYGLVPMPGDLLVSEYNPWKTYSFLGYNPGSYPNKAQYFDVIRQLYPWKTEALRQIANGIFPLWNPYSFSGSPLFANFQSAILYPFNVFYIFFSQLTAWTILVISQLFIALLGTYLYAQKISISKMGSLLAAISYGCSLYMTAFLEYNTIGHTIAWFPFLLYFTELLIKKKRPVYVVLFVFSFVAAFFSGHIQLFGFIFLTEVAYIFARKKNILFFLLLLAVSLGITAVQFLPTYELLGYAARVPQSYDFLLNTLLIQPYQLILFLIPDLFGNPATRNYLISDTYPGNALSIGLIPFVFALLALTQFKKNYFVKIFSWMSIFLLLYIVRTPASELFFKLNIPFFSTGSPTNGIFLLSFSLSILSGFGVSYWEKKKLPLKHIALIILVIFGVTWLVYLFSPGIISVKNLLFSSGIWMAFLMLLFADTIHTFKKIHIFIPIFFIVITVFELLYFFLKFNPFVPKELVFPNVSVYSFLQKNAGINRVWSFGSSTIEANFSTQYGIFSPEGYDPLYPKTYGEFIHTSETGKVLDSFNNFTRSDAVVSPASTVGEFLENKNRLKFLDMVGVKYIVLKNDTLDLTFLPKERFKKIQEVDNWIIFENLFASRRAYLTNDYQSYTDKKEIEKNNVNILSYSPSLVRIQSIAQENSMLFLSDTYYPGWRATVNGKETPIVKANYTFKAVVVPKGESIVEFAYKPASFAYGVKISIISLLLLLGGCVVMKIKKYD